jgi:hypothetical protein
MIGQEQDGLLDPGLFHFTVDRPDRDPGDRRPETSAVIDLALEELKRCPPQGHVGRVQGMTLRQVASQPNAGDEEPAVGKGFQLLRRPFVGPGGEIDVGESEPNGVGKCPRQIKWMLREVGRGRPGERHGAVSLLFV